MPQGHLEPAGRGKTLSIQLFPCHQGWLRDSARTRQRHRGQGEINLDPPNVHRTLLAAFPDTVMAVVHHSPGYKGSERLINLPKVTQPRRARNTLFDPEVQVFLSTRHTGFPEFSLSHL